MKISSEKSNLNLNKMIWKKTTKMIWTQPKQFVPVQKIWTVQRTRHYSSKEMNTSADLFFEILFDDLKVYI